MDWHTAYEPSWPEDAKPEVAKDIRTNIDNLLIEGCLSSSEVEKLRSMVDKVADEREMDSMDRQDLIYELLNTTRKTFGLSSKWNPW